MQEAYREGKDLYAIMGSKVYGVPYEDCREFYPDGTVNAEGKHRRTTMKSVLLEHEKAQRKTYSIMSAGERVMERIWELDIPLQTISDKTGISRSTIYAFLYNGTDLSSMRLAKICSLLGLSMDYVMGLKEKGYYRIS